MARQYAAALVAAAAPLAAVSLFFLLPYFQRDLRYPLGWDAPFYVWRANVVPLEGLDRNGLVRSASPLLLAVLARITGQNSWTMVALVPTVLAGIASLGGAAMVRAALGLPVRWIPVIGIVLWIAFGYAGMVWEQLDNVLNAALVLAAFAAALSAVAWGRGALAAGVLFATAGLAHWQFYLFAIAVFVLAVALWGRRQLGEAVSRGPKALGRTGSLLAAAGASAAFVGLGFILTPFNPLVGPRFVGLGELLRERFLRRATEPDRYLAFPLAVGGGLFAFRSRSSSTRPARDLLLWLAAVWVALTVLGGVAQAFGVPTAGLRLFHYLFPVTLLAGVFLWFASEEAARRVPPVTANALTTALLVVALGTLGAFALSQQSRVRSWIEKDAVREAAAAGAYAQSEVPAGRPVFYIVESDRRDRLTFARWRNVVLSSIPPTEVTRTRVIAADRRTVIAGSAGAVIALAAYAPRTVAESTARNEGQFVSNGVVVLEGPRFPSLIKPTPASADMAIRVAVPSAALIVLLFFVGGAGWARALLPPDPATQVLLSPALGIAAIVLSTLVWERLGLPLSGWLIALPGAAGAAAGWGLAARRR